MNYPSRTTQNTFYILFNCCCLWIANTFAYDYPPRQFSVTAAAYTHSDSTKSDRGKKTASGKALKYSQSYTSAAADWSFLPLGTEFRIKGLNRHFVVEDYNSALTGKESVDLYFPSKESVIRWGKRTVDIIITKYGDFQKSEEILSSQVTYRNSWYVQAMLTSIQNQAIKNAGEATVFEPVPEIPKSTNADLLAAASVPRWLWWRKAPPLEVDCRNCPSQQTQYSTVEQWDCLEIVEPPYPDQSEWEGDPFVVVYAEPIVEPEMKVKPIEPISGNVPFYYEEQPQKRNFQTVEKRFD